MIRSHIICDVSRLDDFVMGYDSFSALRKHAGIMRATEKDPPHIEARRVEVLKPEP